MKKSISRFGALMIASIALAAFLTACGGGGGGSTVPPPPVTTTPTSATGSFTSVAGCTVPDGQSTCSASENWTTGNATNVSVTLNSVQVSTLHAGPAAMMLSLGNNALGLSADGKSLDAKVAVAACADDSAVQNGTCQKTQTALRYTDKVVALWTDGYPFVVGLNGSSYVLTRLTNLTGKQLGSCGAAQKPLTDGHVLVECTTIGAPQFERMAYSTDLPAGTLSAFAGTVPADISFTAVEQNSTQPVANTTSAHVVGGWYYADPNARWRMLFRNDSNGAVVVVKEGTFAADGTIKVIRAYSN